MRTRVCRLVLAALALVLAGVTASQGSAQVSAGFKGGLNVATLGGEDAKEPGLDLDWRSGFVGGGFVNIRIGRFLAIQPEALFSQKGVKFTEQVAAGVSATGRARAHYVEVPLLFQARMNVDAAEASGPFLMTGPYIAYNTSCRVNIIANGATLMEGRCEDPEFDTAVESFDWGVVFGGGYAQAIGRATFILDARYQYGLRSIDDTPANEDIRNKSYAIMLGASLPFGAPIAAARR